MIAETDLEFAQLLNKVKTGSLEQRRGELEVRLGEARLEGDSWRVREIEAELAEIRADMTPQLQRIEVEYPTPLAEAAYYGLVGEIVRAIEPCSEAAPEALIINFLTSFGNMIGDGPHFKVGAEKHHAKLFCVLVGETSKSRKGSSWSPVRSLFEEIRPEWAKDRIKTGLSSGEGLIWHVRDSIYKNERDKKTGAINEVLVDDGVEDKRLLVIEGEFAQTLKVLSREGNTLSTVIRNSWDNGNLQLLTKTSPAKATGAHISIMGHITRQELVRGLSEIETGNGFANRFLWFCVRRSKVLPFGGEFDLKDFESMIYRLRAAAEFARSAGRVTWAEETLPLWEAAYPELSEGRPGIIGAITARAEAQVTRIAFIYALLDRSTKITPAHLEAALSVWGYAEDSVKYIFQNTEDDPLANKILGILSSNPQGLGRREINNALGRNYPSDRISEALDILKASNMADNKKIETGGRPIELWFLNQRAYELNE